MSCAALVSPCLSLSVCASLSMRVFLSVCLSVSVMNVSNGDYLPLHVCVVRAACTSHQVPELMGNSRFMAALWHRAGRYIFVLWFILLSSFFLLLSSPNLSGRRLDAYTILPHMMWP